MKNKFGFVFQIAAIVGAGHFIAFQICHVPRQIELVAFLTMILLYPIIRFPHIGIYLFFIVSPFVPYIRRLYYLEYGRPGTDPLIMIGDVIIFIIFVGLYFEFKRYRPADSFSKRFIAIIACYLVYMVIRTFIFNICPLSDNIGKLKYYAPAVLLFFVGMLYAREHVHFKRLWMLTVIIGGFACMYGLKQLFIGYSSSEKLWFSSIHFTTLFIKGIARPFSFFQSPAAFADYLQLGIIGILMLVSWSAFKGKQIIMFLIPLFFYGILITSVRSNWIGAAATLICWFVLFQVKKNSRRVAIIAGAALFFFMFQFIDDSMKTHVGLKDTGDLIGDKFGKQEYVNLMVTSRTKAIINPFEEHSMISRLALWKYMFVLSTSPEMAILGRGLGALNADSLYVTYLAEFGYPGFIFIIGLFCVFIIRGIRIIDRVSDARTVILVKGIVCMDISFALMNITGTHIHAFPGDAYFWFFNGVLLALPVLDNTLSGIRTSS